MSYDFVEEDNDPSNNFPWHGTSCGGIIGAVQDDFTCGVGIAYNSNLGGECKLLNQNISILPSPPTPHSPNPTPPTHVYNIHTGLALLGATTDMNEERSLTFQNSIVDIYSNSWGPFDSGYIVEGPGYLTKLALETGVNEVSIRESVDSLCGDGVDTPMPPYIGKAFTRTNFEDLSLFRYMIMVCE